MGGQEGSRYPVAAETIEAIMTVEKRLARADLEIKSFDEGSHVLRGMATTPGPDRVGDVVEPMGAKFAAEIPLFLYHDSRMQVGTVKLGPGC
jgi:hypothetical protein